MSWGFYLGLIAFFTIVFTVFSAVTYSAILKIWDSYDRYYHKEELQAEAFSRKRKWPVPGVVDCPGGDHRLGGGGNRHQATTLETPLSSSLSVVSGQLSAVCGPLLH